ncbi:MAG TPA: hypothetical protein VNR88_14715 [Hyphomicrobium sp.]|nr:hypothetical protein [Hyphomicrobium sp.]
MGEGIFAGLLGRLRRRSTAQRGRLFVHEDDWGQIEVLPAACAGWCTHEMARISAFSAAHVVAGGSGWTEVYVREAPPLGLTDLALPFAAVASELAQRLAAFDEITSGTFSTARRVPRVKAFGLGQGAAIVVAPDHGGTRIETIHLLLDGPPQARGEIVRATAALTAEMPLLMVDWPRARLLALSDAYAVERYVRAETANV